jgi:HAD superfamily hydrolase (TIGR01549 family)
MILNEARFLERFARILDADDAQRLADNREIPTAELLQAALRKEGLPAQPPERIRQALGAMYAVYEQKWKLFPETHAVLRRIRLLKLRTALLSNAGDEANVRRMLKSHRLENYFRPIVISAAIGVRKPDPRAFQPILDAWKCKPESLVMVGDKLGMDILGGQRLGMRTIWIRGDEDFSGNRPFLGKVIPDAQVRTIGEAGEIIAYWRKKGRT